MSRINRSEYIHDDCIVHVRAQINNGDFRFTKNSHFRLWKKWALRYLHKYPSIAITVYEWMNSHYHMIIEIGQIHEFSKFMHDLNWRFAFEYNKKYGRKGHFYQARFKCSVIDSDEYEKACVRYAHRNQLRAGMIGHMKKTRWSSYHYYAYGKKDPLVTPFRTFKQFGLDKKIRMLQFRNFCETMMDHEEKLWKARLQHPLLKTKKEILVNYLMKSGEG